MSSYEKLPLKTNRISIVLPVFNNAGSLTDLCNRLLEVHMKSFGSMSLELVFVDDGSIDESWDILLSLHHAHPNEVVIVKLSRNFGQLAAMIAGCEHASGDAIVNMSTDLQDPPDLIGKMVDEWKSGSDLVIAYRLGRSDKLTSRLTSRIAYYFARRSTPGIPSGGFDFTLMSRRLADVVLAFEGRFRFWQGDMLYAGMKRSYLPYVRQKRTSGKSGYTFTKRLRNFLDLMLDSSYELIQLLTRIGFLVAVSGLLYAITIIVGRIFYQYNFSGWAPLMVVLLTTSGLIMIMLGLIAEYQWRIYDHLRGKPVYVVDRVETTRLTPEI